MPLLRCIPITRDANIRDVNENIRANVAFTIEANYSFFDAMFCHS